MDDMPSKMHRVFAALEAYGCNNLDELLTLGVDKWSDL